MKKKIQVRKKKILLTFLGVCLLIGIAASACGSTETEPAATKPAEKTVTVEKTVTETVQAEADEAEPVDEAPVEEPEPVEEAPVEEAPEYTTAQENAIASAENYLDFSAFSKKGLIEQLSSEYGDGFSKADATFAVKHIDVNWNEQAAKSAKNYLDFSSFSRSGLIEQLESEYGDGFTHAQAVYGVDQTGL
jgi:type IV secretory pathway VirB10-like protein